MSRRRRGRSLQSELDELEATNPEVGAAAVKYDQTVDRILTRARKEPTMPTPTVPVAMQTYQSYPCDSTAGTTRECGATTRIWLGSEEGDHPTHPSPRGWWRSRCATCGTGYLWKPEPAPGSACGVQCWGCANSIGGVHRGGDGGTEIHAPAPTDAAYPISGPVIADDRRFTMGLIIEVAELLEKRGYPPIRVGPDLMRLSQALYGMLCR